MSGSDLGKKKRALILGIATVACLQLLQTRIRTAMLAAACGMGFVVYRRFRKYIPLWAALTAITGLLAAAVWVLVADHNTLNLFSIYDRIYFWKVSWAMWKQHPFVGVGVSGWMNAYKALAAHISAFVAPDGTVWHHQTVYHAHNLLLMLLSSTGLTGTAAFIWLYAKAAKYALSSQAGFYAGMAAWPIVIIGIGFTGNNIYSSGYLALLSFLLVMTVCDESFREPSPLCMGSITR